MNSSKMERFLPNECYVCKSTDELIRCDCNLISYCSEAHRLYHLPVHEKFCNCIKKLLKNKGLLHIYEELTNLRGSEWGTKQTEVFEEIKNKLGRRVSPLEYAMFHRPRMCFVCYKTEQESLTDCPNCPVVSFCEKHPEHAIHDINCKVMKEYLDVLDIAEELNIDLKFLPSTFPCITEETKMECIDSLTRTFIVNDMRSKCAESRLLKSGLNHFMKTAWKLQSSLEKIYDKVPEEIVIHIDTLSYRHVIRRENYWEFLLHLNPMIRKLKIVIVVNEVIKNLENSSLCENCRSKEKELNVKIVSKSYSDYMLDENYQKPDILFYTKVDTECNSKRLNMWSEFNVPVVLRFASDSYFCQALQFLSLSTTKLRFIYTGQLKTPFGTLPSIESNDYFLILQSMEKKVLPKSGGTATEEICEETIDTNTTKTPLEVKKISIENLQYNENNSNTDVIVDNSKITPSAFESKDNSDNNKKSKFETIENQSATASQPEAIKITIENEITNTDETEEEKNSNEEETENRESNEEEKSEDCVTLSASSSVRSFVIISGPGQEEEEEEEKKKEEVEKNTAIENSESEENDNCPNSIDNDKSLDKEDGELNNDERNKLQLIEKHKQEEEEQKNDTELRAVNLGNFDKSQTNFSHSFLIDHISYLNHENEELRKRLNASIEEVTKQQIKYEQVLSTLIKENQLMRKVLSDIVNIADIDSVLEKKS